MADRVQHFLDGIEEKAEWCVRNGEMTALAYGLVLAQLKELRTAIEERENNNSIYLSTLLAINHNRRKGE